MSEPVGPPPATGPPVVNIANALTLQRLLLVPVFLAALLLTVNTGVDYVMRAQRLRAAASTALPESP